MIAVGPWRRDGSATRSKRLGVWRRSMLPLLLILAAPSSLLAQGWSSALSFDASVGPSSGASSIERADRAYVATDLTLGWRVRTLPIGYLAVAASHDLQFRLSSDGVCQLRPNGGCVERLPTLTSVSALAGWQAGAPRGFGSVRALVGPAFVNASGAQTLGLVARLDLATPTWYHIGLVGSARTMLIPDLRSERIVTRAWGLGLRLQ